jgi:RNA-directed DNA polymerase
MPVVVIEPRKGKSVVSEGALLNTKFIQGKYKTELMKNHKSVGAKVQLELFAKRRNEMSDAERVLHLQNKLYQKAKQEKGYKFYVLYDKVFLPYLLRESWQQVKRNGGSAGIDGKRIADIETYGVERYLLELMEELRNRTYKPQAVKRVMIPKANGGERPLGIPVIKDRIVQTACKLILEPIFEADFSESSYGFRPNLSSRNAMAAIKKHLKEGKTSVLDADLSKYFDTIPHDKLMIALRERISDPRVLSLIESWLKASVHENGKPKSGKKNKTGTPQGGVISPLLANVYMNLIDRIVDKCGSMFEQLGVKIVRYADDFVLMGKSITDGLMERLQSLLNRMGLSINEEKTKRIDAKEESFNFLGFTVRYSKDLFVVGKRYWDISPSKKSEKKVREKISAHLDTHGHSSARDIARDLNKIIGGWLNYFDVKGTSYTAMSKRRLRYYLHEKLNRYYNRKSQRGSRLYGQKAFEVLVSRYGMIDPTKYATRAKPL